MAWHAFARGLLVALIASAAAAPRAQQSDRAAEARTLVDRGKSQLESGKFDEAVETLSTALEANRSLGDVSAQAAVLFHLSSAYNGLGRKADGLAASERALTLCLQAGNTACEAEAHYIIGTFRFWMGEYPAALERYGQSLSLWEAIADRGQQALVLSEMGWLYWASGDTARAIEHYNKALPLSAAAKDARTEGYIRNNLGLAHASLGDTDAALDDFQQALTLRHAAGHVRGEAQTLGNMCGLSWRVGDYQKALDVCGDALRLARTASDRNSQAWALDTMGLAYWSLGESDRALEQHQEALVLRRAADDRQGLGHTLNNLGWLYLTRGELGQARQYLEEALKASRAVSDPRNEALAVNNLGLHAFYERDYARALSHLDEALRLRRAAGDRRGEAQALHNIGRTLATRGDHTAADEHYRAARDLFRAIADRSSEANTLLALASHAADMGELATARTSAEEALALAESLRSNIAGQDLRTSYLAARQNYYDLYIDVLMRLDRQDPRQGYDGLALGVSERARARSLLETLVEAHVDIRQGVDPSLLEREGVVRRRLDARERSRTELLNRKHTSEQAAAAERDLERLVQEYRDVQTEIRVRSPRYAAVTQPQPLAWRDIQTRVLDDRSLLLEYRLGEERSYLWAVTPTSIHGYTLPSRARIETASRQLYALLTESPRRLARAQTEAAASRLSAMLLGPVANELGRKRLVIVADGILHYIPFAALTDPSAPNAECSPGSRYCPLMVNHEIVSLPSASVLDVIRAETAARRPAPKTLAVFSDPVFEPGDVRLGTRAVQGQTAPFERLPYSRREADAIAALAPADSIWKAVDFDASRAATSRADLAEYRFVHFATHGVIDSEHPELSGLVLSLVDRDGRPQDGFLRVHELYNLSLGADLVVLSACRTALGQEIKGEGIDGLARGFMYAGSPRVVASLWDVRDAATAELMTHFYRGMITRRLTPAAALRAAQTELWRSGTFDAPFYWAGFVLQGEWR